MKPDLETTCGEFDLSGSFRAAERWGSGHINDTFAVTTTDRRYLLQRLNHEVFPDPVAVMENIQGATEHLLARNACGTVLSLVPTRTGDTLHRDAGGNWWRAFPFFEGTRSYDVVPNAEVAREGARAHGNFLRALGDLPDPPLHEVLPGFHETPARYGEFRRTTGEDQCGRVKEARAEVSFVLGHEGMIGILEAMRFAGRMPERVTHNDTKINNVLFDEKTGEGVAVVDLDTVMPGVALYDFGDLVRTSVCPAAGDERDLSKVVFRPEIYEGLVEGFEENA